MAYTKTTWADRTVQYPNRFTRTSDGTYDTLTPAPGTVTTAGTPITASALNNLETGVSNNDTRLTTIENGYIKFSGPQTATVMGVLFFTNGTSTTATANVTFGTAFTGTPSIIPGGTTTTGIPYSDSILHPYIYNQSTTGFSVKISAVGGNLGTVGTNANISINFLVLGN